jgi:hypothetical protein
MTRLSALVICAAIAVPSPALAEDSKLEALRLRLATWASLVRTDRLEPGASPDQCFRDLADAKASGIDGTQKIESMVFNDHPRATGDLATGYWITVDDASYYCARYKNRAAFLPHWSVLADAARRKSAYNDGVVAPEADTATVVAACHAALTAAEQAGVSADYVVDLSGEQLPFGRLGAEICDGLAASVDNARRAVAALRAKYEKHGAKGERLELLIQYDSVYWTLPGGKRTDDPRTLATAKVLFQLLEADDPVDARYVIHTVRKYTFKGHRPTRTEKTIRSQRGTRPPAKAFK